MKKTVFFSCLIAVFLSACVSQSAYDTKAREVDTLAALSDNLQGQVRNIASELDSVKLERERIAKERDALRVKVEELMPRAEQAEHLEKATQTYQNLQKKLEKEIQTGQIQLEEMKGRLTMTMIDKIIFPTGSSEISNDGRDVLDKVISILKDVKDKRIQVEGHTDNIRIVSAIKKRFPTNWELSTARATEVVRYLQEIGGLDPKYLSATGYSEYQPVAPNDDAEGRLRNRRIEIVLLPLL